MGSELQVILNHNGVDIVADDEKLVSLTEIWKANGSDESKRPNEWLRSKGAKDFIASLAGNLKAEISALWKSRKGKGLAGTWAHWQIAMAYSKWVSPDFHQAVNEGFRRWFEEEKNPGLKLDRSVDKLLKKGFAPSWIKTRLDGRVVRNGFVGTLSDHNCKKAGNCNPFAEATRSITLAAIGKTPSEFRSEKGLVKRNDLTRDSMTERELIRIQFAESEATHLIREEAADGNQECLGCVKAACEVVKNAVRAIEKRRPGPAAI